MIAFWIAAALLAAAAAGLILRRAARAGGRGGFAEDLSLAVYRRQLDEIDDLSARGLLPPGEYRSARAEAARRLLAAANGSSGPAPSAEAPSRLGRWLALAGAGAAALAALAIYLVVGSPGTADQPFAKRMAAWRAADPQSLEPAQIAAVLVQVAAEHPRDPQPLSYLARADLAAGDALSAQRALRRAIALAPGRADLWTELGLTLMASGGGGIGGDALNAFQEAHALAPTAPDPRYFLALARITRGDIDGGLADWRALANDLSTADPRKPALLQEIATVEKTGAAPGEVAAQPVDTGAFVQSMVARLAARLEAQPDDPSGWGRLIHAYGVLGEQDKRRAAVVRARSLFSGRADALAALAAAAGGPL
jgi:cytochrome c-type biogenesis protein CcmH